MKTINRKVELPWWIGAVLECGACGAQFEMEKKDRYSPRVLRGRVGETEAIKVACPECDEEVVGVRRERRGGGGGGGVGDEGKAGIRAR